MNMKTGCQTNKTWGFVVIIMWLMADKGMIVDMNPPKIYSFSASRMAEKMK